MGKSKALQIIAALEFGRRFDLKEKSPVVTPNDVWNLCSDICRSAKEHFVVFYLDARNRLIERQVISIGTLNASLVHPREVFEPAVILHSAAVIVSHNHPSGNPQPSADDLAITKRLVHAGQILGIELLDHIIITKNDFFSFKTQNLL